MIDGIVVVRLPPNEEAGPSVNVAVLLPPRLIVCAVAPD